MLDSNLTALENASNGKRLSSTAGHSGNVAFHTAADRRTNRCTEVASCEVFGRRSSRGFASQIVIPALTEILHLFRDSVIAGVIGLALFWDNAASRAAKRCVLVVPSSLQRSADALAIMNQARQTLTRPRNMPEPLWSLIRHSLTVRAHG